MLTISFFGKIARRPLIWVGMAAAVWGIVAFVFLFRYLNSPEYYLAMLKYHGRETKDGRLQVEFAERLVDCGESAIPLLIDEVKRSESMGYRYEPRPAEIVWRISATGDALRWELAKLDAQPAEIALSRHKINLLVALVVTFDDPRSLCGYTHVFDELPADDFYRCGAVTRINNHFYDNESVPLFAYVSNGAIRPEFLEWLQENCD